MQVYGGALPDVEGLTSSGSRFGGEAVQRGLGRPKCGDGGRPAQNGEEGRRQSEGVYAERREARPGAEAVP